MSTIKRNLILKEGQLMNGETLRENKQLLHSMGIFADVNIIPTEVFDGGERHVSAFGFDNKTRI